MSGSKLRVLLAERDSGEAAATLRALFPEEQDRLELTAVPAVSTMIVMLETVNPEVILLDLALAHPDPLDAVRRVHRSKPAVPLIVLAEAAEKNLAVQCLNQGALDYLLKGFMDPRTLNRVLRAALEQKTLDGLADLLRDPVTGLYIRDGFLTLGARALEAARHNNNTLVLLCLRIENWSALRAEFGLHAAESSLREVTALLSGSFRRTDILARLGDSQFAALAVDAAEPSAPVLLQRLEKRITALNRDAGPCGPLSVRMSAGFWSPKDTNSFSEFLDSVESGLRFAKNESSRKSEIEDARTGTAVKEI